MSQKKRASLIALLEEQRKIIERRKHLEEEREKNIERLKVEAKERSLRVAILADSIQSFENLLNKVHDHKSTIRTNDEWINYLKCENLPDTKIPSEVRSFFYKWQMSLQDHWDQQINWWLHCDDRSVLTQTPRDDERRKLIKILREPTGRFYDRKLRLIMKVYNLMLDTLRRRKISAEIYEDLLTLRNNFQETTLNFLDVLTFEVIMHIDREMISVNPLVAHYSYKSNDFIKFISTFKDVTLPPQLDKHKLIKMEPLNMTITVSNLLEYGSSAIRGLWFKHDFFSSLCQSFKPPFEMRFAPLDAAVEAEWNVRMAMTDVHLIEMRKAREIYDQKIEEKRKEEEKNKGKEKIESKPSKVSLRIEIEPPIVDETTYVDVEDEYLAYEKVQLDEERKIYLPENLGLAENEVNMRMHQITNGIFKIQALERPLQTTEINTQMFLRLDEIPHILKFKKFHQIYDEPKVSPSKEERKSQIGKKPVDAREIALAELMKVEIKLTNNIFWWESPKICRWEVWEESEDLSEDFLKLDPETQDFNLHVDGYETREREKLFSAKNPCHYKKLIQLKDFDLTSTSNEIELSVLMKNYLVPMMPEEYKCFSEQLAIYEEKRKEWKAILEAKIELEMAGNQPSSIDLKDFIKDAPTNMDVRNMTYEDFLKFFDQKSVHSKCLFPVEHRKLIEVLENTDTTLPAPTPPEKFKIPRKESPEVIDFKETKPRKSDSLMLSELMNQIENVKESLRPFFREIQMIPTLVSIDTNESEQTTDRPKSRIRSRVHIQRPLSSVRRPSRGSFKPRSASHISSVHSEKPALKTQESSTKTDEKASKLQEKAPLKLVSHYKGKWSTRDIYEQSYDAESKTVTFYTGSLGTFGFATRKYSNLPFKSWEIFPVINGKEQFISLIIVTQFTEIKFKINNDGYTFKITTGKKMPPQEIETPVKVFQLKKILTALNFNLFPEVDASCYIDNNCEKHKAMEFHTYKSMAVYCQSHHFKSTEWNRWAHHRVAIFDSRMILKHIFKRLMVTPLSTTSVVVREKCTDLEVVELDYELTPPEQEFEPDLLNYLKDEVDKREHRANLKNFMMIWNVQALLMNIQPLSYSQ